MVDAAGNTRLTGARGPCKVTCGFRARMASCACIHSCTDLRVYIVYVCVYIYIYIIERERDIGRDRQIARQMDR